MPIFAHCCPEMDRAIEGWKKECGVHEHAHECPDALISAFGDHADYGIIVHDGGSSHVRIRFCPWCGVGLDVGDLRPEAGGMDA